MDGYGGLTAGLTCHGGWSVGCDQGLSIARVGCDQGLSIARVGCDQGLSIARVGCDQGLAVTKGTLWQMQPSQLGVCWEPGLLLVPFHSPWGTSET
jgi:hypothetical protein